MTRTYVPAALRQLVAQRANEKCEYCLYPHDASFLSFEIEHILSEKHGGATTEDNLALACPYCNRFKGSDIGSIDPISHQLTPFFSPRTQHWRDHFQIDEALIVPLTPEGRVTEAIMQLNDPERVAQRRQLIKIGKYPPAEF